MALAEGLFGADSAVCIVRDPVLVRWEASTRRLLHLRFFGSGFDAGGTGEMLREQ